MPGEKKRKIPALRTLKLDTSEYIKKNKISLVDIASEQAKKERLTAGAAKIKLNYKKIAIISFLSLVVSAVFLASFLTFREKRQPPQAARQAGATHKPILVPDEEIEVAAAPGEQADFLERARTALENKIGINKLLNVSIVKGAGADKQSLSGSDFLGLIGASPPPIFLDSLDGSFMLCKFYFTKEWPILIFKINSYDYAFSGMIKWENAIAQELKNVLALEDIDAAAFFEDTEMQNHDARFLRDKNGDIALIYSFVERDYLVVTTGEEPLKEIFRRFSFPQYRND